MPEPSRKDSIRTVMLVEDDADLRAAVSDVLTDEGYAVISAEHGAEALSYLRSATMLPDLIVLDLMMPVMDGWTFHEELQRDARLLDIQVVVYSAYSSSVPINVEAVLSKPMTLRELLDVVKRLAS